MICRSICALFVAAAFASFGSAAKADRPKEITTQKGKPVVIGNFVNTPANCSSNPGPVPLPKLRERPSHGVVALQIVASGLAATDACPTRKVPSIALFYTPNKDFVGNDSVQLEFESGDAKSPTLGFLIIVQDGESK